MGVGLSDLDSRSAVLAAMAECDEIGRAAFLEKYGFGEARKYFLRYEGREYDSKAIVAVAHGIEHPSLGPLQASEFSGGSATVGPKLRSLGFEVVER